MYLGVDVEFWVYEYFYECFLLVYNYKVGLYWVSYLFFLIFFYECIKYGCLF